MLVWCKININKASLSDLLYLSDKLLISNYLKNRILSVYKHTVNYVLT